MLTTFSLAYYPDIVSSHTPRQDFLVFLRNISKKVFCEVLNYIHTKKSVHYNNVLQHVLDKKIVDGRDYVTIILMD